MTKATKPLPKKAKPAKAKKPAAPVKPKLEPNPVGRPTKYKPEYCQAVIDYFRQPLYSDVKAADGTVTRVQNVFPTMARFADKLDVARDTLIEWAAVHPEFSDSYKRALTLQESILQEGALAGAYHGSFAIFTAKNVCGWRDQQHLNVGGDKENPLMVADATSLLLDRATKFKAKG